MLNWIVSSTVLILVVTALRFLLKGKISLRLQYALWAIVLVRLLIPGSFGETAISVGNWIEQLSQKKEVHEVYEFTQMKLPEMSYQQAYEEVADRYVSQGIDIAEIPENEFAETVEYEIVETMTGEWSLAEIAKVVWLIGGISVGLLFLYTNLRFQRNVLKARREMCFDTESMASDTRKFLEACTTKLSIYLCDEIETPCVFGLFHPAVYVTNEVTKDEEVLRHVIAHEITHYLHRDYIWGVLRAVSLTIHWYNPFVWYAAILSRNDAELACDEAAIERLGERERVSYGRTLIELTCEKRSDVLLAATTMTGSGKSIKERIAMIVKRPKTKRYVGILVAAVVILCAGCTFTGADTDKEDKEDKESDVRTEADSTESKSTVLEIITEIPEGFEEEQESLRLEMEQQREEAEHQREVAEHQRKNQADFYQNMENGALVMDQDIINRITSLLQNENEFDRMLNSGDGHDGTQDKYSINGQTVFLIEEAARWDYYEDLARKYYSDEYIENEFTPFFLNKVYIEKDGKLYRTFADGIVNPLMDSTIKVWLARNGKYYVSITSYSAGGGFYPKGYVLDLSEDSIFGFEIVEKVQLLEENEIGYEADLTHDGIDERIRIEKGQEDEQVKIQVYDNSLKLLYEKELLLHPNLGESYFLTSYDGKEYLMYYKPSINHETVSCEYEVFYLSDKGGKISYDADQIEVLLVDIPIGGSDGLDMTVWKMMADKENKYFDKAFLLASTLDGKLTYSTENGRITYMEDFSWLIENGGGSIEENLEFFRKDIQELYGT